MLRQILRCSFCRRPHTDVEKLVAGPARLFAGRVYICDRCAARSIEIMDSHIDSADPPPRVNRQSIVRRVLERLNWIRDHRRASECQAF